MIYYVTEVEDNGDETILMTFDDELDACKYALGCYLRDAQADEFYKHTFRVDSVEPSKEFLSSVYGKVMHRGHITAELYRDSDSLAVQPQRDDFKWRELFPTYNEGRDLYWCRECGAVVGHDQVEMHVSWHNKLLP